MAWITCSGDGPDSRVRGMRVSFGPQVLHVLVLLIDPNIRASPQPLWAVNKNQDHAGEDGMPCSTCACHVLLLLYSSCLTPLKIMATSVPDPLSVCCLVGTIQCSMLRMVLRHCLEATCLKYHMFKLGCSVWVGLF